MLVSEGMVEPGDVIVVKTFLGENNYPITRVTKTLAISRKKNIIGDWIDHRFKRVVSLNMCHPADSFNVNQYTVFRNIEVNS